MEGVSWICNLPESEIEFTTCLCLTFRLIQIKMAELISSLIYDIVRGTTNSCFLASQRDLASVLHREAFLYPEENSLEL